MKSARTKDAQSLITDTLEKTHAFSAWKESSPVVGSSKNNSIGLPSSSQAMLNRFFSPPLRPRFLASPNRHQGAHRAVNRCMKARVKHFHQRRDGLTEQG
jgi:hypothetical protein